MKKNRVRKPISEYNLIVEFNKDPRGKKFIKELQNFIVFLIKKHNNNIITEELVQDCFCNVFEKIKHFDAKKGNLISFIYSLCKNSIYKYRYYSIQYSKLQNKVLDGEFDNNKNLPNEIGEFKRISFSNDFILDYSSNLIIDNRIELFRKWKNIYSSVK